LSPVSLVPPARPAPAEVFPPGTLPAPATSPAEAVRALLEETSRRARPAVRARRRRRETPPLPSAAWNGPALGAAVVSGLVLTWMTAALCFLFELNLAHPVAQWLIGPADAQSASSLIVAKK